jgi:plasmid stabilization system protein ParE
VSGALRLTPKAREGFLRIVRYVHDCFGRDAADRVIDDLEASFDRIANYPSIGHRRSDLTSDDRVRFWSIGPTLIAYLAGSDAVVILMVESADLDWSGRLRDLLQ